MMKRSKLELYIDVLRVIKKGQSKPTRIMYSSNLSWNPLKEALDLLESQRAITSKTDGDRKQYFITEKGRSVIEQFDTVEVMLRERS